jgi:multicomponent Na+:H+ antiporter subunit A
MSWRVVVLVAGVAPIPLGGWAALRQHDLKLLLGYGTVSQLGLLTVVLAAVLVGAFQLTTAP